jgi:hypothetical protein
MWRSFRVRVCPSRNVYIEVPYVVPHPVTQGFSASSFTCKQHNINLVSRQHACILHVSHVAAIDQADLNNSIINTFAPQQRCFSAMSLPLASTDVAKSYFAFNFLRRTLVLPRKQRPQRIVQGFQTAFKATKSMIIAAQGLAQANVPSLDVDARQAGLASTPGLLGWNALCRVAASSPHTCHEAIRPVQEKFLRLRSGGCKPLNVYFRRWWQSASATRHTPHRSHARHRVMHRQATDIPTSARYTDDGLSTGRDM